MATRSYINEQELRRIGFSEPMVNLFRKMALLVDTQAAVTAAQADIVTNATDIASLNANDVALDARLDAIEALRPYVRQDLAAAPVYTPYAGQTVSVGYVQAEAQATDDAVKALATAFDTLLTGLVTANVLT